jgi:hypothetical protein
MQGLLSNARGYSGTTLLGEATCCRCSIGETGIGHVGGKGRFSRPRAAGGTPDAADVLQRKKWNRHLEDVGYVLHAAGADHSLRRHSMRSSDEFGLDSWGCISHTDRRPSFALPVEDLSGAAVVGAAPLCDDCHLGAGCGALPVVLG